MNIGSVINNPAEVPLISVLEAISPNISAAFDASMTARQVALEHGTMGVPLEQPGPTSQGAPQSAGLEALRGMEGYAGDGGLSGIAQELAGMVQQMVPQFGQSGAQGPAQGSSAPGAAAGSPAPQGELQSIAQELAGMVQQMVPQLGQSGAQGPAQGRQPLSGGSEARGSLARSTAAPQGTGQPAPASIASSYNIMMEDLSANGTSPDKLKQDAQAFQSAMQANGGGYKDLQTATANMVSSLNDGTFSQQGSQGALEGAATKDGLTNVDTPQIDGNAGQAHQSAGNYDAGKVGSMAANANILQDEMAANPSDLTQVRNNAEALSKEAAQAGDTNLASAADNIAKSASDGTYDAGSSSAALKQALDAAK